MISYENGDVIIQTIKNNPVGNLEYGFFDTAIWLVQDTLGKGSVASKAIHAMIVSDAQSVEESRLVEATTQDPGGVLEPHMVNRINKETASIYEFRVFRCNKTLLNKQSIGERAKEIARLFLGRDYDVLSVIASPFANKDFGKLAEAYVKDTAKKMFSCDEVTSPNLKEAMFCSKLVVLSYQLALISQQNDAVSLDDVSEMKRIMPLDAQNCSPASLFQFLLLGKEGWSEVK